MNTIARLTIHIVVGCALTSSAWAQGAPGPTALQTVAMEQAAQAAAQASAAKATAEAKAAQDAAAQAASAAKGEQERASQKAEQLRAEAIYARGAAALDAGRWNQALEAFAEAVARAGERADGALYWKAYAEYKLAEKAAALNTLQELRKRHPASRWLKEAQALEVEVSGAAGGAARAGANPDEELKLLAINSLIHSDSEQALPMLETILAGQHSPQLKKRALFVLAQSKSPKARDILLAAARESSNPDLQLDALRYIGMFGGTQNLQVLAELYASSKNVDVRRRILETYMISGQRDLVLQAAKAETDAPLRAQAVRLLGAMNASGELDKLYQVETSAEVRRAIVKAYMIGGNGERLAQIARTDREAVMRLRAIEMLGALGRDKNAAVLGGLYYAEGQTKDARRAVINALFISGDAKTLVEIARKETDPELRKAVVERLSMMKSKEATDFLMELISK